ncbi:MAG: hypothetical protein EPO13_03360 [Actinomycetota bacterium]|nr:MAG: hypothetical protein EPO13_03360 [Actinomycetota bacterium]
MSTGLWVLVALVAVVCSVLSAVIAARKGYGTVGIVGFAVVGFVLPLVGLVVVALLEPQDSRA